MLPHETMHLATPKSTLLASPLLNLIASAAGKRSGKPSDAVLLSQVQTLTLRGHDALTTSRRVSAVPQTKCISHRSLCALAEPKLDVMRCENMGSSYDDADVEWSCSASLPEELRLGSTDVICEGYENSDDPFVSKGSCGVEYRVVLTDKGEQRYPDLSKLGRREARGGEGGSWGPFMFFLGVVAIMFILSYLNRTGANQNRQRPGGAGRGNGGGGGGNGWGGGGGGGFDPGFGGFQDEDDPPPPYPGRKTQGGSSRQTRSQTAQEGWRPGFWSGLATGGAAGYGAGRWGARNNERRDDRGGPSSGSGAGASGSSYESTGFGSTSRR